jgi:transcriptional regulator with XRE-family HTH domain
MGQAPRPKPKRLAEKLLQIRTALGLSQNRMIRRLGLADMLTQKRVSAFELGEREPSLPVLLQYARVAGVWVDVLIDDELDLPVKLPTIPKHEGIPRKPASKRTLKR